jgi:hypothetical protein
LNVLGPAELFGGLGEVVPGLFVLGIDDDLPGEDDNRYSTLGGFLLHQLGQIPREGEKFQWDRFEFEIIDMDRQRIDKVLVTEKSPKKKENNEEEDKTESQKPEDQNKQQ